MHKWIELGADDTASAQEDRPIHRCARCYVVPQKVVEQVHKHEHGKVQRRKVMMKVCDATHEQKWEVLQEPADPAHLETKQEVIPRSGGHIMNASLTAQKVPGKYEDGSNQRA